MERQKLSSISHLRHQLSAAEDGLEECKTLIAELEQERHSLMLKLSTKARVESGMDKGNSYLDSNSAILGKQAAALSVRFAGSACPDMAGKFL